MIYNTELFIYIFIKIWKYIEFPISVDPFLYIIAIKMEKKNIYFL